MNAEAQGAAEGRAGGARGGGGGPGVGGPGVGLGQRSGGCGSDCQDTQQRLSFAGSLLLLRLLLAGKWRSLLGVLAIAAGCQGAGRGRRRAFWRRGRRRRLALRWCVVLLRSVPWRLAYSYRTL